MKSNYFIGIDMANKDFATAIYHKTPKNEPIVFEKIENNKKGFQKFVKLCSKFKVDLNKSVICMEHCGVYTEQFCLFFSEYKCKVVVEDARRIQRAFRKMQPKNDIIDAKRIAQYAYRFYDELTIWKPKTYVAQNVQSLLTLREQLVKQSTALKNLLTSQKKKAIAPTGVIEVTENTLQGLKSSIKEIEKQLKQELACNPKTLQKIQLLCSIPGVSTLMASHILVLTNEFNIPLSAKKVASHLGICPNEYSSGTSIYKKPRSRGFGPSLFRKLIHLAALSLYSHEEKYKEYMNRKVDQGKNKMVVINKIRNKLLKIIAAVLRDNKPYVPFHVSISPVLLEKGLTKS